MKKYLILIILILGTIATSCKGGGDFEDRTPTDSPTLSVGEPEHVLDADEIAGLTIDYSDDIPVEAILGNKPGYEQYYEHMLQQIKETSQVFEQFELYGEKGCYLSTTILRHFDTVHNTLGNVTYALLFSKDFEKRAAVAFYYNNDEINISIENSYLSPQVTKLMQEAPDTLFIFLLNGTSFDSQIASDNSLYLWSKVEQEQVKVKGDYFHSLDYETLAVSYSTLTDQEHLIWIDIKN